MRFDDPQNQKKQEKRRRKAEGNVRGKARPKQAQRKADQQEKPAPFEQGRSRLIR